MLCAVSHPLHLPSCLRLPTVGPGTGHRGESSVVEVTAASTQGPTGQSRSERRRRTLSWKDPARSSDGVLSRKSDV